jgi:hypothetical protein
MGYVIVYKIIQIKSEGKEQIDRPDVDGRLIFRRILSRPRAWIVFIDGPVAISSEHGNDISGSIKDEDFFLVEKFPVPEEVLCCMVLIH